MAATKLELIENRRTELQAAFLAFGSVSEQLSGAFDSLRSQVAQLRADLGAAHAGKEHLAARLSALVKGLPGGVIVLDSRGAIQEYNPAALDLLGEPLLGQLFSAVCARATLNPRGMGEHTELRSGRFVNVSRRELENGGEVVLLTDVTEAHLMQVFLRANSGC
jgi:two-component system sensor histidine kinase FlrB